MFENFEKKISRDTLILTSSNRTNLALTDTLSDRSAQTMGGSTNAPTF